MKYGVIHYNTPGANLEEFLAWAAESGFDCVELRSSDIWPKEDEAPGRAAEEARKLLEKYGLSVSAVSAQNDFNMLEDSAVAAQIERMKKVVEAAQIVGAKVLRTEGGSPKDSVPPDKWHAAIAGCLRRCIPFIEPAGIALAVDNHGIITNNGDLLYAILTDVNHPLIGTNLDTMNYRWYGNDLATCDRYYTMMAPLTKHTHLKDGTGSRGEYVGAALGDGEVHLEVAIRALKAAGYEGPWVAEWEGRGDKSEGYRKCLKWMQMNI